MTSDPRDPESPLRDVAGRRPLAARETVHEGAIFDLVRDTVDFAADVQFDREYLWHSGSVAVLAVDEDDRVLMIRQYRHAVGMTLWEIPAGLLDLDGEAPHVAAARELAEESGYAAEQLSTLVDLRPTPGASDEVVRVYLATGIREADEDGFERVDEEAELTSRWVPLAEAVTAVLEGRISNGPTVSALLALQVLRSEPGTDRPRPRAAEAPFMQRPGRD